MSVDEFRFIAGAIRPFTSYVYLHVLGEPLLHPHFEELLQVATAAGLNINLTTNGALIEKKKDILLRNAVRQINISLHDAEENISSEKWNNYLDNIFSYALFAADKTYVNLRLWNAGVTASSAFNQFCIDKVKTEFKGFDEISDSDFTGGSIKLANHIFLQRAPRFDWPDAQKHGLQTRKTCYALRDHIAILSDGTVVPCCLDADGSLALGNIFTENLSEILSIPRAQEIKKGFGQHKVTEPLCATCGFIPD